MKVLVFPHRLIVSGATITAVDLAGELQRSGHEVTFFAEPGPMVQELARRDLGYLEAPGDASLAARWPSRRVAAALRRAVRETEAEVVHTYEWPACLEALIGPHLRDGVPLVSSVMSMTVPRFMPKRVPLIVGTQVLRDEVRRRGHASVTLLEPPVDVDGDSPSVDGSGFRRGLDIPDDAFVASIISRLSGIKLASTTAAIDAVDALSDHADIRLVIAGDGDGERDLRRRADAVNDRAGRNVVLMPGLLEDPREAYAASDVVLGMGGSALRGLAFGKSLIVVGTDGYSQLFTPETSGEYLVQGFWGHGDGGPGTDELIRSLRSLIDDPALRADLGAFGRRFVCTRFSLADRSARLESVLQTAAASPVPREQRRADAASAIARLSAVRLQGWLRRRGSRLQAD